MSDFKPGDEIWFFVGSDQGLVVEIDDIKLKTDTYKKEDEKYIWTDNTGLLKSKNNAYYKSKDDAIDAMIKYLESIKEPFDYLSIIYKLETNTTKEMERLGIIDKKELDCSPD